MKITLAVANMLADTGMEMGSDIIENCIKKKFTINEAVEVWEGYSLIHTLFCNVLVEQSQVKLDSIEAYSTDCITNEYELFSITDSIYADIEKMDKVKSECMEIGIKKALALLELRAILLLYDDELFAFKDTISVGSKSEELDNTRSHHELAVDEIKRLKDSINAAYDTINKFNDIFGGLFGK